MAANNDTIHTEGNIKTGSRILRTVVALCMFSGQYSFNYIYFPAWGLSGPGGCHLFSPGKVEQTHDCRYSRCCCPLFRTFFRY